MKIKLTLTAQCASADPHLRFAISVAGVVRGQIVLLRSDLTTQTTREDLPEVITTLLRHEALRWKAANPAGTNAQMKTALEAMEFFV